MGGESKQSTSAKTALIYLTTGSLMCIWTALYYVFVSRHDASESVQFWSAGFFCTGLVLVGIGLAIGRIGRSARAAEVAPTPDVVVSRASAPVAAPVAAAVPVAPVAPVANAPAPEGGAVFITTSAPVETAASMHSV